MSLTVYEMPYSPFCIPIVRALEAAAVKFDRVEVPNWDRRAVIEVTKGGYYQVPVLVHDGKVVFESGSDTQDVAHYIDQNFCGGRLFPPQHEGMHEILIHYLENDVESATFRLTDIHYVPSIEDLGNRGMVIRHKERKFGRGCLDAWRRDADKLRDEAEMHLSRFDAILKSRPFLRGEEPIYADFLLYGMVGNYTFNGWNELPKKMAALTAWFDGMSRFWW